MSYRMNGAMWNTQPFNGQGNLITIAGDMTVLYNQRTIILDWGTVDGANFYTVQVSLYADFRSFIINANIEESDYTFTDTGTDDAKRYWRWRPSVSSGANYLQPWSEVGSYWLDTGASEEIEVARDQWAVFDPDDVTDRYWFDLIPTYTIVPRNIYRFQGRNRNGDLLSEFLTSKDEIWLQFTGAQYIAHAQADEFRRFHNVKRDFFLATYTVGRWNEPMPHIWKVELTQDPSFSMLGPGRPDLLQGNLALTEV